MARRYRCRECGGPCYHLYCPRCDKILVLVLILLVGAVAGVVGWTLL